MKQYIDKSEVVAEIEKLRGNPYYMMAIKDVLLILDSLEVKEVDLEKHLKEDIEDVYFDLNGVAVKGATYYLTVEDVKEIAKHFYELGLKTKGETELLKVRGYLVRDKDDYTAIYAEKPHRGKTEWVDGNDSCLMTINDARLVPDIEFEEEPVEVEVVIKAQKGE